MAKKRERYKEFVFFVTEFHRKKVVIEIEVCVAKVKLEAL